MLIKDLQGKYTVNFDERRRIAYELNEGLWKSEDVKRWHDEYVSKIKPLLGSKSWLKCSDIRGYKTSTIADEISKHDEWAQKNGLAGGVIIVESAVAKMQMKRALANNPNVEVVTNEEEAEVWLRSKGF